MNNEVKEIIEKAAERYANEVIEELDATPPEQRKEIKSAIGFAYFRGACELWEVLSEVNRRAIKNKTNTKTNTKTKLI